jgi:hypothetical protein
MKKLFFLLPILLLQACAVQPVKELYYRSRLPTMELPYFKKENGFGVNLEIENQRFTAKMTRNLVTDFNFYRDNTYFSKADGTPTGWDLAFSYARPVREVPLEAALSGDFVQLKIGLFGYTEAQPLKAAFNVGWYRPTQWTEDSKCELFDCLFKSPKAQQDANDAENGIRVESRGNETKTGITFSYDLNEEFSALLGMHWMNYYYAAKVTNQAGTTISFEESFFSSGLGLGAAYRVPTKDIFTALTIDRMLMSWNGESTERFAFGLRTMIGF